MIFMERETKIEIKSIFGNLLFSYSCKNNDICTTLKKALKEGADLYGANLEGADLFGADLYCADLEGADLRRADLRRADLYGADLYGANLEGANLYDANLYGANLEGADLRRANLEGANLEGANLYDANLYGANLPIFCKWSVSYNDNGLIKIGCKAKTIEEWDKWFESDEEYDTPRNSEEFKRIYANYVAIREYVKLTIFK